MSTALETMQGRALRQASDVVDVLRDMDKLWDLANILLKSRMIPGTIPGPEAAVAIILKGRELGIGPMHAFDSISVIQGKPTISPQLMLALIERSGQLEDMAVEEQPESCSIALKRRGRTAQRVTFDRHEAASMGLWGKGNWAKMPGVMLYWRCVAKACRRVFPDVIAGCYTPEEMGADTGEDGEIIEGEVVAEYRPTPAPRSQPGLFTRDHVEKTAEFMAWLSGQCRKINAKWHEEWDAKLAGFQAEGLAVPDKVADVINPWQAKKHLLKWCVESERVDPALVPEDAQTRQTEAYVALVYHQSREDRAALKAEMGDYLQKQRQLKCDAIYRKHPELAPDGWQAEQDEVDALEALDGELADEPANVQAGPQDGAGAEPDAPRLGRELFAWAKDMEQRHDVGLLKYLTGWAKLQGFPGRMMDWDKDQVALAHAEAVRKLRSLAPTHGDAHEEALSN